MKKAINIFFQLDALKKTMKRQFAWIFSLLILNYVKKGDSYTVYHTEPCTECSTKEAIDSFFRRVPLKESHENITIIFQSHITKFDHKWCSGISFCYTGLYAGWSAKEAINSFFLVEYFNKNTICIDFHFHSPKSQNRVVSYSLFTRQCYLKGALRKKQL